MPILHSNKSARSPPTGLELVCLEIKAGVGVGVVTSVGLVTLVAETVLVVAV